MLNEKTMPLTINKKSSLVFVVVIVIFVLQYFFQLFYDQKFVSDAPSLTGKEGKKIKLCLIYFEYTH